MRKYSISLIIIFLTLLFSVWGCTGVFRGYGGLDLDQRTTRAFETFQIKPGLNYYYSGSDVYPNALIGIDQKYKLEPADLWKKWTPTEQAFKEIISQMQGRASSIGHSQYGFNILDDRERVIGIWYSIITAPTTVKIIDEQTVLIHTPDLDTYTKHDEDRQGE